MILIIFDKKGDKLTLNLDSYGEKTVTNGDHHGELMMSSNCSLGRANHSCWWNVAAIWPSPPN